MAVTMKLAREDVDTPEKREKYTISVVGCGRVGLPTACLFAEVASGSSALTLIDASSTC